MQPPADRSQYVQESLYHYACKKAHKNKSGRYHPNKYYPQYPVGTWKIDDEFQGPWGHLIEELQLLDPRDLIAGEITEENRFLDIDRYVGWMEEGLVPPPVNVVETIHGHLRIYDGHRRWYSTIRTNSLIFVWVNPITFYKGHWVGLTYEIANNLLLGSIWERLYQWFRKVVKNCKI